MRRSSKKPFILKERIAALLADGQGRTHEKIVRELECSASRSRGEIKKLKDDGQIHISGWVQPPGKRSSPIFSRGAGPDVPLPEIPKATRDKIYKHKVAERQRQWRLESEKVRPIARDPWVAALFGDREPMPATPLEIRVHQWPMDVSDELEAA